MTTSPAPPIERANLRARTFLARLRATFRVWAAPTSRPLPRVEATLGLWVPVWLVSALMGGIAIIGGSLVVGGPLGWVVITGCVAVLVLFPEGPTTGIYAVTIGVILLISGTEPFAGRVFVLVALVHLVAVLDSLVSGLPGRARLQLAALRDPFRRFAAVQVAAQALALLGAVLTGTDLTVAWLPVVAALGLASLGWLLNLRLEAAGSPEYRVR